MLRLTKLIAALAAATVGALGCVAETPAAVPAGNLLGNAGAEDGPNPPWNANGTNFDVVTYGAPNLPSTAIGSAIGGGTYFFAGGADNDSSYVTQTVDVASAAPEIDAGRVSAALSGHLGGWEDEDDSASATAETQGLDSATPFSPLLKIGPVTASDRGNKTALLPRSASEKVPPGTRRIRVTISATRTFGTYNDGYADNLSLVLTAAPVTAPPVGGNTPPVRVTRRGRLGAIKVSGRRVKGRVSVAAPCKAGRRVVIKKGKKTLGSARSKANGRFNIKTKKHKKGKLSIVVRKRTLGNTTCAALKKKIPGRN